MLNQHRISSSTSLALAALVLGAGPLLTGCMPVEPQAQYIGMADGVRIAADLWVPKGASAENRVPVVIRATRYWRAFDAVNPAEAAKNDTSYLEGKAWTDHGYAAIFVDARGSGASFGAWTAPWSDQEVADYNEIVNWLVAQPWCNGRVGAHGVSYDGNTAERIGSMGNPAVKAVAPRFGDWDTFADIAFPGGILNDHFVNVWDEGNRGLDANDICAAIGIDGAECDQVRAFIRGVKPVDAPSGRDLLTQAIAEHAENVNVYDTTLGIDFREDGFNGTTLDNVSPFTHDASADENGTACYAWASWLDGGTARGVLERFNTGTRPQTVIIGAWNHGAELDADPFHPVDLLGINFDEQFKMMESFFAPWLKGPSRAAPQKTIQYYTLNAGIWQDTNTWPPVGAQSQILYFAADGELSSALPAANSGADTYAVDFTATTGVSNRWYGQIGGADVDYGDRAAQDAKLLTYTTAPLESSLTITGSAVLFLQLVSTTSDGAVIVYLEDVAPDGRVTYITEGELRVIHRALSDDVPYAVYGPYHSMKEEDAAPLVPDEVAEVQIELMPTSVRFDADHRIRIALAGHDADTFERLPATGNSVWTVQRNSANPSYVVLPAMN